MNIGISFTPRTIRARRGGRDRMIDMQPEARMSNGTLVSWAGSSGTVWYAEVINGAAFDPFVDGSIYAHELLGEPRDTVAFRGGRLDP